MVVIYAGFLLDGSKDIPVKIINQPQTRNFLGLLTKPLAVDTILVSLTDWGENVRLLIIRRGIPPFSRVRFHNQKLEGQITWINLFRKK